MCLSSYYLQDVCLALEQVDKKSVTLISGRDIVNTSSRLKLSRLQKTVMVVFSPEISDETVTPARVLQEVVII